MNCTVPATLDGQRLDRAVAILTGLPRSTVRGLLAAEAIRYNGEPTPAASKRVTVGQQIEIATDQLSAVNAARTETATPTPTEKIEFKVVHEDEQIVVIDKPVGLVTHPGAGHLNDTLLNGLLYRYPDAITAGPPERPAIVHRLDRDTSGLLVCALTFSAHEHLSTQLAERKVARQYVTFVRGTPNARRGTIDAPINRSFRNRTKMQVSPDGRPAQTDYIVLGSAECANLKPPVATLLSCQLRTGRTHQIRVHLASINLPVLGDAVYGCTDPFGGKRQLLHAVKLSFKHPATDEPLMFVSEPPADITIAAQSLGLGEALAGLVDQPG